MSAFLKYSDIVESQFLDSGPKRKGDRTRDQLKLAALRLMEEVDRATPRISDICERANVSPATLYLYYPNSAALIHELLSDWVDYAFSYAPPIDGYESAFDAILVANRRIIELYATNPGIIQSLWQHRENNENFAKIWERNNLEWYRGVTTAILEHSDTSKLNEKTYTLIFYVISSLMDEFLRTIYIARDRSAIKLIQELSISADEMAEYLSITWYRLIFGQNPENAGRALNFLPVIKPLPNNSKT